MAAATAPVLVSLPGHFSQAEHGGLDRQASPALGHQVVDGNKSGLGGPGNLKCHQYFSSPFRPVTEAQSVTQTGVHPLPRAGPRPLGGLSSGTGSGSRGGRVRACDPLGRPGGRGLCICETSLLDPAGSRAGTCPSPSSSGARVQPLRRRRPFRWKEQGPGVSVIFVSFCDN